MDVRMRRARREDYDGIWQATLQTVWDDTPEDERPHLERASWEKHFRRKIEPYIDGNRTEAWIAEAPDRTFLGYVIVGAGGGFLTPEPHGFIFDVWVAPEHRGQGVGRHLVSWAVEWAKQRGYRKVKLEVAEANERARRLYEELGFRVERRYMGRRLE